LGRCDENGNETQTAANRRILAQMFTQMFTPPLPKTPEMGKHLGKHFKNLGKHFAHRECKKLKFRTIDK
jgi:hypothetical protein